MLTGSSLARALTGFFTEFHLYFYFYAEVSMCVRVRVCKEGGIYTCVCTQVCMCVCVCVCTLYEYVCLVCTRIIW